MDEQNTKETPEVSDVDITGELINKLKEVFPSNANTLFKEFSNETCTYSDPPKETTYKPFPHCPEEGCDSFGGWQPDDDADIPEGEKVPAEWLESMDVVSLDTVLGVPRTKSQFRALKKIMEELESQIGNFKILEGHPVFPKYTKDLDIKWAELLKIEDRRRRVAQCQQLWKDMWAEFPEIMRETLPDYAIDEEELKGLVTIYINVGQLPMDKAELYIDKIKKNCKKLRNIPLSYGVIWLPVRPPEQNRIEVIRFDQ